MFSLTVFLQKSDGTSAEGVVSLYDQNHALVARESSIDGAARVDVLAAGRARITVASEGRVFLSSMVEIPDDGEGEITLTALPTPTRTPLGPDWCSVSSAIRNPIGEPTKIQLHATLTSGDYRTHESLIYNQPKAISAEQDGSLYVNLLKGRTYELSYIEAPYGEPETYVVSVPRREHADLYDLLYPYAVAGFVDQPFTGNGTYTLTILLSDGRELTTYKEVQQYIYSVEADNAEVTFTEAEDRTAQLSVTGQPGAVVRVAGNRRGDLDAGPADTLRVYGSVFLTLVS